MRRISSESVASAKSRSLAASTHSTPRPTQNTSHSVFPSEAMDLPAVPPEEATNDDAVCGASPPHVQPRGSPLEPHVGATPPEGKKKKKEKGRKGRPQNALLSLASAVSGGAALSANVVDLRCLDTSSSQVSCKRSVHTVQEAAAPTKILEFLYLGSVKDAQDPAFLSAHHIRYIINVSQEEYWSVDKRVQIFTFKVDDCATADIGSLFSPTRSLINNVRERYYRSVAAGKASRPAVLVHCQKGRSRSATIVLAYLIYTNGWSVAEAMKYVATRRPCVEPNIGFMEELRKLQESFSTEERTRRYSELCWFMRNLDAAQTSVGQVRETFEQRVGMVRDVVMLTAPGSHRGDNGAPGEGNEGGSAGIVSFSMGATTSEDAEDKAVAFLQSTAGEEEGAETREPTPAKTVVPSSAAAAADAVVSNNKRVALCFVFLTCREDILRGIKHGQLRDILEHLRPAPGKQIKYATGPKLRKLMTEHQSMSSSFAQDMSQKLSARMHDSPVPAGGDTGTSGDGDVEEAVSGSQGV
jgi:dual specificity phosphatase 12